MKKTLTLILAFLLLLGAASGCAQNTELRSYKADALQTDPGQRALAAYAPDAVVMTIDGSEVRWDEFAFWLCTTAKDMTEDAGVTRIEDWNAVSDEETGETYAQVLMETVLEQEKQFHSLEAKAKNDGIRLGSEGEEYIEQSLTEALESFNIPSEEEGADVLRTYYLDTDVLRYQSKISYLYLKMFEKQFGTDGEKIPEADLQDYINENGYRTVRHILLSTVDENNEPISDSAKEKKLTQAKRIIERLLKIKDQEELVRQFDRYTKEYNEDAGVEMYPNGYCFTEGQMDEAFEAASSELEAYQVGPEPVETAHGYHVVMRVPTTGDDALDYNEDGTPYLLRTDAAQAMYTQQVHTWIDEAEVEWAEGFENLDVQTLFVEPETFWDKIDIFHWFH